MVPAAAGTTISGKKPLPPHKPKGSGNTNKVVAPGRKLSKNNDGTKDKDKISDNLGTDVEELTRLLESDKTALMNMKRDLNESQQQQITKFREGLYRTKGEFDHLRVANNTKEKTLLELAGRLKMFLGVSEAENETGLKAEEVKKNLQLALEQAEEDLAAETRTQRMFNLMNHRLDEETNDVRAEAAQIHLAMEACKFEYTNTDSLLRVSKSELFEQEKIMENLSSNMKQRMIFRKEKHQVINSVIMGGELVLGHMREEMENEANPGETSGGVTTGRPHDHPITAGTHDMNNNILTIRPPTVPEGSSPVRTCVHSPRNRRVLVHSMFKSDKQTKIIREAAAVAQSTAVSDTEFDQRKGLTISQIIDLLDRYRSRNDRLIKLEKMDTELQELATKHKEKTVSLTHQLNKVAARRQHFIVNHRQGFQEMEIRRNVLHSAQRSLVEYQEQDHHVKTAVETMRTEVPRLTAKIRKTALLQISNEEMPGAIHRLEDEISNLIKDIDSSMIKEMENEDIIAFENQQSNNNMNNASGHESSSTSQHQSEIGRLQKLPGYPRLKKQLIVNLMTAPPDITHKNIRVLPDEMKREADRTGKTAPPMKPHGTKHHDATTTKHRKGFLLGIVDKTATGGLDGSKDDGSVASNPRSRSAPLTRNLSQGALSTTSSKGKGESGPGQGQGPTNGHGHEGRRMLTDRINHHHQDDDADTNSAEISLRKDELEYALHIATGLIPESESLSADAVKNVSALIVERETAILKAKQRAEEARIRLIMGEKFRPKEEKSYIGSPPPIAGIEFLYTTY